MPRLLPLFCGVALAFVETVWGDVPPPAATERLDVFCREAAPLGNVRSGTPRLLLICGAPAGAVVLDFIGH